MKNSDEEQARDVVVVVSSQKDRIWLVCVNRGILRRTTKNKKFSIDVLFVIRQYLAEMQLFESLESDINIDKIWGLFYKTRLIQLV